MLLVKYKCHRKPRIHDELLNAMWLQLKIGAHSDVYLAGLVVFNATFNNISAILWRSVLLVEKPEDPKKTTDLSKVTDKLDHIMLYTMP